MIRLKVLEMKKINVIGFTGTIASGKTARCHKLVHTAWQKLLGKGDVARGSISLEEALQRSSPSWHPQPPVPPVAVRYINADLVAHGIYAPGTPCYYEIVDAFGREILQGNAARAATTNTNSSATEEGAGEAPVNRRALGAIVFADPNQMARLNAICQPHIRRTLAALFDQCRANALAHEQAVLLLVLEAALLVDMRETLELLCTDVWMTHCSADVAVQRVMQRDGLSAEQSQHRVSSQPGIDAKKAALSDMRFSGGIELFDTSTSTLEDGLRAVDERFEAYWGASVAPYL